jgi:hypothetical protein
MVLASKREEWLEQRRRHITSTDTAAIEQESGFAVGQARGPAVQAEGADRYGAAFRTQGTLPEEGKSAPDRKPIAGCDREGYVLTQEVPF